jgi:hypothetical protein
MTPGRTGAVNTPPIAIGITPALLDGLNSLGAFAAADEIWLCDGRQGARWVGQK